MNQQFHKITSCHRLPLESFALLLTFAIPQLLFAADRDNTNPRICREIRSFPAVEAHQAVAVDAAHFYAITNRAVSKYDKATGKKVAVWKAPADSSLKHLNSGVVVDGTLYAAHSNWPAVPTKNSVEMWNAKTLKHSGRQEFDERGAMTWIDRHDGHWWIVFAHYGDKKSVQKTRLVKYNDKWKKQATWTFPDTVIARFLPYSNSGGSWGPDGRLYVTGHDRREMYALRIPKTGTVLELVDIISAKIEGQGIAWDRSNSGLVYGIRRKTKEVVVLRLPHPHKSDPLKRPSKRQNQR